MFSNRTPDGRNNIVGVKVAELRITCPTERRANVFLNGEYFGVYDFGHGTFVN